MGANFQGLVNREKMNGGEVLELKGLDMEGHWNQRCSEANFRKGAVKIRNPCENGAFNCKQTASLDEQILQRKHGSNE